MKKIFIAADIFPPQIGGPATYSVELANALKKRDFKVRILCYGQPDKSVLDSSIKINYVNNFWPTPLKYFFYFLKLLISSSSFSTIYSMGPVTAGYPAYLVGKILNKKLIVKVVGDYAWEQASQTGDTKKLLDDFQNEKLNGKMGWLQKIEKRVCQRANAIITPSQYLKNIVAGWGVDENKIKVIYNSFKSSNTLLTEKNKNLILSVGRLVPWKGFDTLIKLMPELLTHNPDFKLLILGPGPDKQRLLNLVSELKLNEKVTIKCVNHNELLKHLSQAGIFVLNTSYEGLSHVILEAMSAGTPVITTNVGGNPETVQHEHSGLLIEYNNSEQLKNAILKVYNNSELQKNLTDNALASLNKFDFENMINQTIGVLEKGY